MRALRVGDDALLVEVASGEEAEAVHAELLRRRAEGLLTVREIVPAARTVLLDGLDDPARLASELAASQGIFKWRQRIWPDDLHRRGGWLGRA